jgi:hypothetical protein
MTTPQNYEPPSERAVPGAGGYFEPADAELDDAEAEEEEPAMVVLEDDELKRREQDRERREEDDAP